MRTATLLAIASVVLTTVAVTPAAAAECSPAGGAAWATPQPDSNGDFVFAGKGFGHGVGMSQYGARGAARLGCTATDILTTYYTGVTVEQRAMPDTIRVGLVPNAPTNAPDTHDYLPDRLSRLRFTNTSSSPVPWRFDGADIPPQQPAGATWRVDLKTDGTIAFFVIVDDDTNKEVWRSEDASTAPGKTLVAALDGARTMHVAAKGHTYRWGRLELYSTTSGMVLTGRVDFEKYLYGLAEMPSSWETEALKSQAIVGRAYAAVATGGGWQANCRCDLYDSMYDQAYSGYDKESEGPNAVYGKRWVAAVDGTRGRVITRDGSVVTGNYASSHGGHSEDVSFVWGGSSGHLQAVDDSRWEAASDNPYRTWTARFSPAGLGRAFGVGTALEVQLPSPKGESGRIGDPALGAGGMRIVGTERTITVSGNTARSRLGLRSTLFRVINPPLGGTPVTGDWDGDGDTDLGWFRDGDFALRMGDGDVVRFRFGRAGDVPVTGDWDGDGRDTIGVVRDSNWYLRDQLAGGEADRAFIYGRAGDVPLPGNWDGAPGDEAGIIRDGTWHLNDTLSGGRSTWSFHYGRISEGDIPITGKWQRRQDRDLVGIVRDGEWHLRFDYAAGGADHTFTYGRVTRGDVPVAGDWDRDGDETPGVVRDLTWLLRNHSSGGEADRTVYFPG